MNAEPVQLSDVRRIAKYAGMEIWLSNDARGGRFRIARDRDILHHGDDLEDIAGWLTAWVKHVAEPTTAGVQQ